MLASRQVVLTLLGAAFIAPWTLGDEPASKTVKGAAAKAEGKAAKAEPVDADLAAIRAESVVFVDAFNRRDAKALAKLWTDAGEYLDETGHRHVGRAAIESCYADYFSLSEPSKLRIVIDSLRKLSNDAAIEEGRAIIEPAPEGATGVSRYVAMHVRVAGQWRLASVRDSIEAPASHYHHIADLDWLIGDWEAEEHGVKNTITFQWIANRSFIQRSHRVRAADGSVTTGMQIIGWNPQLAQVQSWSFQSDGGHSLAVWIPVEDGWRAECQGMTGEGAPTTAINHLRRLDDQAYLWWSTDRSLGGTPLPNTDEIVIKRRNRK